MGYLGVPFRVFFESKNFVSGLTDVVATVVKPNNDLLGPFVLSEFPNPLQGIYYFDFDTNVNDMQGEYLATIFCPTQSIKESTKMSLYNPAPPTPVLVNPTDIYGEVIVPEQPILGTVNSNQEIVGISEENSISGIVEAPPEIHGHLEEETEIEGEEDEP